METSAPGVEDTSVHACKTRETENVRPQMLKKMPEIKTNLPEEILQSRQRNRRNSIDYLIHLFSSLHQLE